ncbi:hypothetical protein BT96DRAFT_914237 [Gymnopus androsaceus JB14]|uniref:Uncharacterized protein n=1 Tax=Gymnopus androsaceus JB14 TaxID=1447944 RepID=A0A6A4IFG5_9AGAR|nr:hypothetical protein BT96DRAFT_914237 [Gymnopus androsaceus JB14]
MDVNRATFNESISTTMAALLNDPELAPGIIETLFNTLTQTRSQVKELQREKEHLSQERDTLLKANEENQLHRKVPKDVPSYTRTFIEGSQTLHLSDDAVAGKEGRRQTKKILMEKDKKFKDELHTMKALNAKYKEETEKMAIENTTMKQEADKIKADAARQKKLTLSTIDRLRGNWSTLQENFAQIAEDPLHIMKHKEVPGQQSRQNKRKVTLLDPSSSRVSQVRKVDADRPSTQKQLFQKAFSPNVAFNSWADGDTLWPLLVDELRACDECSRRGRLCTSLHGDVRCDFCVASHITCSLSIFLRYRYFARQSGMNITQSQAYFDLHADQYAKEKYTMSTDKWSRFFAAMEKVEDSQLPVQSSSSTHV